MNGQRVEMTGWGLVAMVTDCKTLIPLCFSFLFGSVACAAAFLHLSSPVTVSFSNLHLRSETVKSVGSETLILVNGNRQRTEVADRDLISVVEPGRNNYQEKKFEV